MIYFTIKLFFLSFNIFYNKNNTQVKCCHVDKSNQRFLVDKTLAPPGRQKTIKLNLKVVANIKSLQKFEVKWQSLEVGTR